MFLAEPAISRDNITPDGSWWQSLSQSEKVAAIIGMYGGFRQGWFQGTSQMLFVIKKPTAYYLIDEVNKKYPKTTLPSFGTISDRIDAVYRDYPELIHMPAYILFPCAAQEDGCAPVVRANEELIKQGIKPAWTP